MAAACVGADWFQVGGFGLLPLGERFVVVPELLGEMVEFLHVLLELTGRGTQVLLGPLAQPCRGAGTIRLVGVRSRLRAIRTAVAMVAAESLGHLGSG
ncbi:hypothetical protein CDO52_01835 [Nocardiopsis gilva YIM 90087]|uniref:Uncharacterized protein n=1 Tax=Nocardiopsis gilva YIM 90087 TaxID=1235441 RepID=A0A223S0N9_9ACTN|nr:hypothetical protein CDO52_01835 [Nocardiopsis gilva YIM 90087]